MQQDIIHLPRAILTIQSIAVRCVPKGAGLPDFIHSKDRLKYPEVREPGTSEWKRISWNDFNRIAALFMKEDRDANFIAKNEAGVNGQSVAFHRIPGGLGIEQ